MVIDTDKQSKEHKQNRKELEAVVVYFAGDSGDGMQVTGNQLTETTAVAGNDAHTFAEFPAEIRAPSGTLPGISGFQICFSKADIHTHGDNVDVLIAMNPAALKVQIKELRKGGILLVDEDKFVSRDLIKAGFEVSPLESGELTDYTVIKAPITSLTLEAVGKLEVSRSKARKCKNMFALGTIFWLFGESLEHTKTWLQQKYSSDPTIVQANIMALQAGYNYALTAELFAQLYAVGKAELPKGLYRQITGNEAIALGCLVAAHKSNAKLLVAGYPITPSSDILHYLAKYREFGVKTFQAEDEICSMGAVIGAAYGGSLAMTCTSGPGMDLKMEAIGLAVMAELPLVVVDVQRAGPSTGMPTKPEQSDLLMSVYGRHGECPVPVIAAKSPSDCFATILEAFTLAVKYMTPVIVLSDAYLANGAEPWLIPEVAKIPELDLKQIGQHNLSEAIKEYPNLMSAAGKLQPYARDKNLARAWVAPGVKGLEHRIGGLEKQDLTGNINYTADNHQKMVDVRQTKVKNIAEDYAKLKLDGDNAGDILLISWGSTFGAALTAVEQLRVAGYKISHLNLRYLNPLPKDLTGILKAFTKLYTVELNKGQLANILRSEYLLDVQCIGKVTGKPFKVIEIVKFVTDKIITDKVES